MEPIPEALSPTNNPMESSFVPFQDDELNINVNTEEENEVYEHFVAASDSSLSAAYWRLFRLVQDDKNAWNDPLVRFTYKMIDARATPETRENRKRLAKGNAERYAMAKADQAAKVKAKLEAERDAAKADAAAARAEAETAKADADAAWDRVDAMASQGPIVIPAPMPVGPIRPQRGLLDHLMIGKINSDIQRQHPDWSTYQSLAAAKIAYDVASS